MTGYLRHHTRAAKPSTPRTAEQSLIARANAVLDAQVMKDADRARAFLDAQTVTQRAGGQS